MLDEAAADPWLSEGGTIVFCGGARRASRVVELIRAYLPRLNPAIVHGQMEPRASSHT